MARALTCGLCGRRFVEDRGQRACRACPLSAGCRFVRCPACGYENPVEPEWLARLWRRRAPRGGGGAGRAGGATLADLRPGDGATVVDVDGTDPRRAAVLASLGLLPGVAVTVVQRWPAWVVRLGFAEVALDTELARQVRVERRV